MIKRVWESLKAFCEGAFKLSAYNVIRKEAFDANDNFLLLLFSDLFGIPNPVSYYTLEILPFLTEELEGWEWRMQNRKSILAEKIGEFDFCC
jgi:DNA polymerase III delta prime subunit